MEKLSSTYLLSQAFLLLLILAIYHVAYRRRNAFRFNRGYLLMGLVFSIITPLLSFDVWASQIPIVLTPASGETAIRSIGVSAKGLSWQAGYMAIAGVLLAVYICRLLYSAWLMRGWQALSLAGSYTGRPVSFFGWIALPNQDDTIVAAHEHYHVQARHSWDRLALGLAHCFFWVNPLFFLLRRFMVENHEYSADLHSQSINKINPIAYLEHLAGIMRQYHAPRPTSMLNTYDSLIQNRIQMIQSNAPLSKTLAFACLPILLSIFCAFTFKSYTVPQYITPDGQVLDTLPKHLLIVDTVSTFDTETKLEKVMIVKSINDELDKYLRSIDYSGHVTNLADTVTTFDTETYEETVEIIRYSVPKELEELMMHRDFFFNRDFILDHTQSIIEEKKKGK